MRSSESLADFAIQSSACVCSGGRWGEEMGEVAMKGGGGGGGRGEGGWLLFISSPPPVIHLLFQPFTCVNVWDLRPPCDGSVVPWRAYS